MENPLTELDEEEFKHLARMKSHAERDLLRKLERGTNFVKIAWAFLISLVTAIVTATLFFASMQSSIQANKDENGRQAKQIQQIYKTLYGAEP